MICGYCKLPLDPSTINKKCKKNFQTHEEGSLFYTDENPDKELDGTGRHFFGTCSERVDKNSG